MLREAVLTARKAQILRSVVRAYIDTGEPVASKAIAGRRQTWLSAASVRNVMAELCEEGYLSQPHTSAGRVPTEKAFREFVRDLPVPKPSSSEIERLRTEYEGAGSVERTSHLLTELTRNVGIAAAIPASSQVLNCVELLPLADRRVLVVVVTAGSAVHNRVITLEESLTADELASIRNYLNYHFSGWMLAEARRELQRRLELESAYYDALLGRLRMLHSRGFLDIEFDPEVHLEGAANLFALDLHLTWESMRRLLRALEEKRRILQILDRFLESAEGAVHAQVGLGEVDPAMKELSLIGIVVPTAGGMTAKIAVLGPMRMHYEKVMAAVALVGRTLQSLPS